MHLTPSLSAGNHCQVALWFHHIPVFHKSFDSTLFILQNLSYGGDEWAW